MSAIIRTTDNSSEKQRRISIRLLMYLLMFSGVLAILSSLYVLRADYNRAINSITESITQIEKSYQKSLSYSLWSFDTPHIKSQLEGILNFPGVAYVYIESRNKLVESAGSIPNNSVEYHNLPLIHKTDNENYHLGRLHINIDYSTVKHDLKQKAINILITEFLKIFSISIIILFLVRHTITKRLSYLVDWLKEFNVNNLDNPLIIKKNTEKLDELDVVVNAINDMRLTLMQDMRAKERSQQQLEDTKGHLAVAIDNAALGFCQYYPIIDRLTCNNHFARHLATTQAELQSLSQPMRQFSDLIRGIKGADQKERIQQLLYGRISRLQGEFTLINFRNEICYFDMTLQTIKFNESRPEEILICIVDKTKEQTASRQAQDLAVSLENKVKKRTEELYEEQQRTEALVRKLKRRIDRMEAGELTEYKTQFQDLLLRQLNQIASHTPTDYQDELNPICNFLQLSINDNRETTNIVKILENWFSEADYYKQIHIEKSLPYSLILDENPKMIIFLLDILCRYDPVMRISRALSFQLSITSDLAVFHFEYALPDKTVEPISSVVDTKHHIQWDLCCYIVQSRFRGQVTREFIAKGDSSPRNKVLIALEIALYNDTYNM